MRSVVLIGMKYVGKSTVGEVLARRWNRPFHDVDRLIEDMHERHDGQRRAVREIFSEHGVEWFTRMENLAVCDLFMRLEGDSSAHVVSVGGRTAVNPRVNGLLGGIGKVVYLRGCLDLLLSRLRKAPTPAFLNAEKAESEFAELYRQRSPVYEKIADCIVDVQNHSAEEIADRVEQALEAPDHAR